MKNTVIALCIVGLSICSIETTQAQGLLGRLKDKISNAAGESSSGKPNLAPKESILKAGKEDMADTTLDKMPFADNDPLNMNGIYYTTLPIYGQIQRGDPDAKKPKVIQKFHINYFVEGNNINYVANSRFSLDKSKDDYVEPLKFYTELLGNKINKQAGMLKTNPYPSTDYYSFIVARPGGAVNNSGVFACDKEAVALKQDMKSSIGFYIYEPGIIVMMDQKYYGLRDITKIPCFEEFKKTYMPIIFYKKENETRALAITKEEIHKRLTDWNGKYIIALDKGDVGMALPRAGDASLSPVFAAPKAQVLAALKTHLAGTGQSYFVPEYSYIYNDNPHTPEVTDNRMVGGMMVNVKIGHATTFYVICKNLKPDLGNTQKSSSSKYVFFQLNLFENVKGTEYNTDNYTGKWYVGNCSTPYGIADDENPMKYKGK